MYVYLRSNLYNSINHFIGENDFVSVPGIVTFPLGSVAGNIQCLSLTIHDDEIQEIDEHFTVFADREDLFSGAIATVVIQDNDSNVANNHDHDFYSLFILLYRQLYSFDFLLRQCMKFLKEMQLFRCV